MASFRTVFNISIIMEFTRKNISFRQNIIVACFSEQLACLNDTLEHKTTSLNKKSPGDIATWQHLSSSCKCNITIVLRSSSTYIFLHFLIITLKKQKKKKTTSCCLIRTFQKWKKNFQKDIYIKTEDINNFGEVEKDTGYALWYFSTQNW